MQLILQTTPAFDNGVARGCPQGAHLLWSKMPKVSHPPHTAPPERCVSQSYSICQPHWEHYRNPKEIKTMPDAPHFSTKIKTYKGSLDTYFPKRTHTKKCVCCMGACVHLIHKHFLGPSFRIFLHLASKEGLT